MRVLLIEDDEMLGAATRAALERKGMRVDWVRSGSEASAAARTHEFDAFLLDLGLPDLAGDQLVRQVRELKTRTPLIVLTARNRMEDRVTMLDLGADDYLVKPVDISELCARLRAVRRRTSAANNASDLQTVGPLELLLSSRTARWFGEPVALTSKEFDLLETLVLRRPRVISRAQIEDTLYGWGDEVESNAIEVYVHFLRRKFTPALIVTVRGKGYQIGHEDVIVAEALRKKPPTES